MLWRKRKQALPRAAELPIAPLTAAGSYLVGNLQGQGRRGRQEDAFCFVNAMDDEAIRREGLLAVLADGMGGMEGGKLASEAVTASFRSAFPGRGEEEPGIWLERQLHAADEQVYRLLHGAGGSTAIACLLQGGQLWYVSVGDSALFLLREGVLLRLNRPQNVLTDGYLLTVQGGSADPNPARSDDEGEAITQFVGVGQLREIDGLKTPLRLHRGDCLLICSDGVSETVPRALLRDCLQKPTPPLICAALDEAVRNANHPYQDNYTALVIQVMDQAGE